MESNLIQGGFIGSDGKVSVHIRDQMIEWESPSRTYHSIITFLECFKISKVVMVEERFLNVKSFLI